MLEWLKKNIIKSIVLFILVLTPIFTHLYIQYFILPKFKNIQNKFETYYDPILADLQLIDKTPPFPDHYFESNADDILKKYVPLIGELSSSSLAAERVLVKNIVSTLKNKNATSEQIKNMWADIKQVNTSWMKKLLNYDHWSYESRPEIAGLLKNADKMHAVEKSDAFQTLPIPDYFELENWDQVNILKMQQEGNIMEALAIHRKTADLIHSSGLMAAQMMATRFLLNEHDLVENYKIQNWNLIPKNVINAYKKVSWAWRGIVQMPIYSSVFPEKFYPYIKMQNGVCASLWENFSGFPITLDYLEPKTIFEYDFSARTTEAKNIMLHLSQICNKRMYNAFYKKTDAADNPFVINNSTFGSYFFSTLIGSEFKAEKKRTELNYSRIPYVRKNISLYLLSYGDPNSIWTKYYDEKN